MQEEENEIQSQLKSINGIVKLKKKKDRELLIYIPVYLRVNILNFDAIDLNQLHGQVRIDLFVTVYIGEQDDQVIDAITQKIYLGFNKNGAMKLNDPKNPQIAYKKRKNYLDYTIRTSLSSRINGHTFFTPFEIIDLYITITLHSISFEVDGYQKGTIQFNLMDLQQIQGQDKESQNQKKNQIKLSFTNQTTFAQYDLAQHLLDIQYTNEATEKQLLNKPEKQSYCHRFLGIFRDAKKGLRLSKVQQVNEDIETENLIKNVYQSNAVISFKSYQYAHINIPLYKYPCHTITTVFLPVWLLGIINLGIFFQSNENIGQKIINSATIFVAFAALVPTIRQQIPNSQYITFTELLIYLQAFTIIIGLAQAGYYRNQVNFEFIWYYDPGFLTSAAITFLNIVLVFGFFIWHKFYREGKLNKDQPQLFTSSFFKPNQWNNKKCQQQMNDHLKDKQIILISFKQATQQYSKKQQKKQNKKEKSAISKSQRNRQ